MSDGARQFRGARPLGQRLLVERGIGIDAELGQRLHIVIERMAGEVEAHRLKLLRQLVHRQPGVAARQHELVGRVLGAPEQIVLPGCRGTGHPVGHRQNRLDRLQHLRPVGVEAIEGAGLGHAFQRPLVQHPGIDAPGEVTHRLERSAVIPYTDEMFDGPGADILQGRHRIDDGAIFHREIDATRID